jgi:hypothetical protein
MSGVVPEEIRDALGMPEADMATACERIRTMRQTEVTAEYLLFRSGSLSLLLRGTCPGGRGPGGADGDAHPGRRCRLFLLCCRYRRGTTQQKKGYRLCL